MFLIAVLYECFVFLKKFFSAAVQLSTYLLSLSRGVGGTPRAWGRAGRERVVLFFWRLTLACLLSKLSLTLPLLLLLFLTYFCCCGVWTSVFGRWYFFPCKSSVCASFKLLLLCIDLLDIDYYLLMFVLLIFLYVFVSAVSYMTYNVLLGTLNNNKQTNSFLLDRQGAEKRTISFYI